MTGGQPARLQDWVTKLITPARLLNSIACQTGKLTERLKNIIGLDTVQPQ